MSVADLLRLQQRIVHSGCLLPDEIRFFRARRLHFQVVQLGQPVSQPPLQKRFLILDRFFGAQQITQLIRWIEGVRSVVLTLRHTIHYGR
ncbi:hypothetical protein [Streptomyces thermoviolaceus]|uniref:Uncharacterized protein n=1 Tax=Streptomyces thermoviolaceus subsp. thermoviolaceus TaxID=66860 RepID=A0ABX0YVK1_STRTL|nr:hypothetical protein [Streptomyces thermoviolaceus]NJP15065.1 hypothetical protein [Streptomyces thermoviolaceus subsp. thermoviolaceus]WTD47922.1 hypothetical protein OG899_10515 [Streptomyces thermoviolaceus]GGV77598.1 hypothetical protein GCM10010499_36950 [Streptomyces thermoviolaceus subsp. apingens]GHB00594.1 hypothetical protein GCM10010512_34910 [Streptomyces thermoviolaceus subsp. thermoviolaceus]